MQNLKCLFYHILSLACYQNDLLAELNKNHKFFFSESLFLKILSTLGSAMTIFLNISVSTTTQQN